MPYEYPMPSINLKDLSAPFPAEDVEWRLQQSGEKNGRPWAKCLAYITNRAIMQRLDDVCGPENWRNEYKEGPSGGLLCGISVYVTRENGTSEWVTKWDGAENTDIEAVKGGLSGAMKRAAVQFGIGRYLYNLEEGWAKVHDGGRFSAKAKTGGYFKWDPPQLPAWALPDANGGKPAPAARQPAPAHEAAEDAHKAVLDEIETLLKELDSVSPQNATRARTRVEAIRSEINGNVGKAEEVAVGLRSVLATIKQKRAA